MIHAVRALFLLVVLAAPAQASQRVVSLNLCTDQMLVMLAPDQVAALSPLARDPTLSIVAKQAASMPVTRASAEAVLRLHPDLVLAAPYGAQTTLGLLEEQGIKVQRIDLPTDFSGIRAQTRKLAALLGVPARGEALIATMDAKLAALKPPDHPVRALVWQPRGYTAGPGSLADAVLRAAGLTDIGTGRQVGLEALLQLRPDLLVLPVPARSPSLATELLDHPATAGIPRRFIPPALTICAGPWTADAAVMLDR
ncbi:MAG: ABC transporter substrate-binding protein [Alphaproteobacteria bacterium]|nr:ABC transporter substrate-binding protein [Alphaproteobacteria bacterium]